jgi:hypothetical protein
MSLLAKYPLDVWKQHMLAKHCIIGRIRFTKVVPATPLSIIRSETVMVGLAMMVIQSWANAGSKVDLPEGIQHAIVVEFVDIQQN